jgi:hypothetical protein
MTEKALVSCGTCNYANVEANHQLTCHRYAPQAYPNQANAVWPFVQNNDWCADGKSGGSQRKSEGA